MHRRMLVALAAFAAGAAAAQEPARPDPTDPRATVPQVVYRSVFEGYRPLGEDTLAPWRESNDAVREEGKDGGHAGHAAKPEPKSKPKPKPAAKPQPGGEHGSHR